MHHVQEILYIQRPLLHTFLITCIAYQYSLTCSYMHVHFKQLIFIELLSLQLSLNTGSLSTSTGQPLGMHMIPIGTCTYRIWHLWDNALAKANKVGKISVSFGTFETDSASSIQSTDKHGTKI